MLPVPTSCARYGAEETVKVVYMCGFVCVCVFAYVLGMCMWRVCMWGVVGEVRMEKARLDQEPKQEPYFFFFPSIPFFLPSFFLSSLLLPSFRFPHFILPPFFISTVLFYFPPISFVYRVMGLFSVFYYAFRKHL